MIKKTLLALVGLVVVAIAIFAVVAAAQPDDFKISRSAAIPAPPERVFTHVNDFHKWEAWSPWIKLDPNSKATYSGPASGQGASFAWAGNHEVGEGRMTITESRPNERILINLEFIKPFEGTSLTEFTFQPQDGQTLVTWTMSGKNNFVGKAVGLLMNCDKMIGEQFEKGLANMKAAVQSTQ